MNRLLVAVVSLLLVAAVQAADWPQFQGPDRSNVSKETGLLTQWPKEGPKLLWTLNTLGDGYSGPAIVGENLYIAGADAKDSYLFCVNVTTGKEKWRTKLGTRFTFQGNQWGDGPRATPSVVDGLVYALDGGGEVVCASAADGKEVWRKSLPTDFKGQVNPIGGGGTDNIIGWGYSASPLVDGEQVVLQCGGPDGALVALNRKTGAKLWQSTALKDQASYASPLVVEIGGVKQYIVLLYRGVAGVAAKDGKLLWFYDKKPPYGDVLIPTPIYQDGYVYVNNGMGAAGCDLIKITESGGDFKATKVYANKLMKNINGGLALVEGYVYGYSDKRGWICQDFLKGTEKWSNKQDLGAGALTAAEGHLYLYGEDDGMVKLIEASSAKWVEKGSFEIPQRTKHKSVSGKNWTYPVIANGKLYLRDQELLFCYDIKK